MLSIQIGSNFVSRSQLMNMDTYNTPTIIMTQWGRLGGTIWRDQFVWESGERKGWLHDPAASSIFRTKPLYLPRCPLVDAAHCFSCRRKSARKLLPPAFRSEFYIWNVCAEGGGGFLMGSVHKQIFHTHTHTSLSSARKHPCILPLRTASC